MESIIKAVIGASNNGGKLGTIFTYVRYVLFLITLVTFVNKFFLKRDTDEIRFMPDEVIVPKATNIRDRIARHIMKQQMKSKDMALKDYGKSLERREYEAGLDLFPKPVGYERFIKHQKPEQNLTNITAYVYDVEREEPTKLESYLEEVPTLEFVKYFNSKTNPQLLVPAWLPNDKLDLSLVFTDYNDYFSEVKNLENITLNSIATHKIDFPFNPSFDLLYNGEDDLFLEITLQRSADCEKRFNDDDSCDVKATKKINLIQKFTDIDSKTNEEVEKLYYNPKPLVQLIYNHGELLVSELPANVAENVIVDDFTGRRDNSSGVASRYFPFIQYDNFKHSFTDLIELKPQTEQTLKVTLSVETESFIKWKLAMDIAEYALNFFVKIPFTFVESRFHFIYKLDAFKKAMYETSYTEKVYTTSLVIASVILSNLFFFKTEARFNANISANKSFIFIILNMISAICLIANGFKYSLTAIGFTVANAISLAIRINEQYHWRFYEPVDPKPKQFTFKKKFGLKELIAIDLYPKFNKDVLKQEQKFIKNEGYMLALFVVLPAASYIAGSTFERDGQVLTLFSEFILNMCLGIMMILKLSPLARNFEDKRVYPYDKYLLITKIVSLLINGYICFTFNFGLNFKIFLLYDAFILVVYKYQEKTYKLWKNIKLPEVTILEPKRLTLEEIKKQKNVSADFVSRMKIAAEFDAEEGKKKAKAAAEKLQKEQESNEKK
ncbi:uncharacterized protein HGUI_00099 [Hanseniaspora guilliermondii]|uniref:Uncharacterized protein n=1 Tax=Hanseniaspora guilliermondii TaxID=56406 RepID=A0A1L0AYX7_9ASCO|nr:uncharacterized protein HGUI_00099 [Hanseniaspora guilliermondii]